MNKKKTLHNTVSMQMVRQALQEGWEQGMGLGALLKHCQLPPDIMHNCPNSRLPVEQFAEFWRQLSHFLDDEFCGMDQRAMRSGSFAFLCQIAAQQPTVEAGINVGLEFMSLMLQDMKAVLYRDQNLAQIILLEGNQAPKRAFTYFTFWMYIHGLTCWLANQRLPILAIDSRCAQPDLNEEYQQLFTHSLSYHSKQSRLLFVSDTLDSPIRRSSDDVQRFISQSPANILVKYRDPQSISGQIRQQLHSIDIPEWPESPQLAEQLCMSVATLRRRLNEEGQSVQMIKDSLRKSKALDLLALPEYSFVDIAHKLGFADTSSFYKAFRKWTGIQPGFYRSSILNKDT